MNICFGHAHLFLWNIYFGNYSININNKKVQVDENKLRIAKFDSLMGYLRILDGESIKQIDADTLIAVNIELSY